LDQELTYAALDAHTTRVARLLLLQTGVAPGDRVVLVYPPSLDFMLAFVACLKAGVVAVPVFPPNPLRRDTLHMFSKIVAGCGARVALSNRAYNHAKKMAGIQERLRVLGKRPGAAAWPDDLEWILTDRLPTTTTTKAGASLSTTPPMAMPAASDVAFLQYTSGTCVS
jgi:acyl-CoA synthetase (AMP-forming)/AMP-acid ligase II